MAVMNDDIKSVALLLQDEKLNVNKKDKDGNIPLIMASQRGQVDIVQMLFKHESTDVNIKNDDECTALHLASEWRGHTDIVKVLLNHQNIDVNVANKSGRTALHIASERRHTEIVKLLSEHPNININQLQNKKILLYILRVI